MSKPEKRGSGNGSGKPRKTSGAGGLSKEQVRSNISSGIFILAERTGESEVWKAFYDIQHSLTNETVDFVQCKQCSYIYSFKKGSSTSALLRHKCKNSDQTSNESSSSSIGSVQLTDVKTTLTEKIVEFCAKDLRPFETVAGTGFREVAQELINIGAKCGRLDVNEVIPHPTTVSRNVAQIADKIRAEIIPEVKEAMVNNSCAIDTDMWTDQYTQTHYLTLTVQYINKEWELKSYVLFTTEFPEVPKTGENIRKEIIEQMALLDISLDILEKATFVSDQGANIKLALSEFNRIPCTGHIVSTVLRHTLDEAKFLQDNAPEVAASIHTSRNLVGYLKRSGACKSLDITVKQMIEVRWNTVVDMLESMSMAITDVINILESRREMHRLNGWNGEIITDLIKFLSLFKETSVELQAKKVPTLHMVLIRYQDLMRHCEPSEEDSDEIGALKGRAKEFLQKKLELKDEHYVASFLCPHVRSLKLLAPEDRQRTHEAVAKISRAIESAADEGSSDSKDSAVSHPPSKKSRFGEWLDDSEISGTIEEEMNMYRAIGKLGDENPAALLQWWKNRESIFPRLAKVARKILCIPATSASSERNFSRAGLILTDKRSTMSPENVNDLLLIHNYYLDKKK